MSAKDWLLTHVLIDAVVNYGTVRTVPTRSRRDSTLAAAISKAIDDYKRAEASVDAGLKTAGLTAKRGSPLGIFGRAGRRLAQLTLTWRKLPDCA